MKKELLLIFILVLLNLNIESTIVRNIVLKQKVTGQTIGLYGDYHHSLKDYHVKDDIQFKYIMQHLNNYKESCSNSLLMLYEGGLYFLPHFLHQETDILLLKIRNAVEDDEILRSFCKNIENRKPFFLNYDKNILNFTRSAASYFTMPGDFIAKMEENCSGNKIAKEFQKIISLNLKEIKDLHSQTYEEFFSLFNNSKYVLSKKQKLETSFEKLDCKYRINRSDLFMVFKKYVEFGSNDNWSIYFDINALYQIAINNNYSIIVLFAGAGHVNKLRDLLLQCNYELIYDSGIILNGKRYEKSSEVLKHENFEETETIESSAFDLMLPSSNCKL